MTLGEWGVDGAERERGRRETLERTGRDRRQNGRWRRMKVRVTAAIKGSK